MNTVQVSVSVESGCSQVDGEYSLHINQFIGALDINAFGGIDDATLIKGACDEFLQNPDTHQLTEGYATLKLEETGEWEDVFWHKYYEVTFSEFHEL